MPRQDPEQTSYTTDISEQTGWADAPPRPNPRAPEPTEGLFGRLRRLVVGSPSEDHDAGRELRRAVRAQDVEQVRAMIRQGVGVNEAQEASLACIAARRANMPMLKLLVEAGVDVNRADRRSQTSKARTPIQEAARKGWLEGVVLLLDLDADVDACEEGDVTALHIAARMGHADVVRALLKRRADPGGDRRSIATPMHETASPAILTMLLQAGAAVDQRDRNKCTALHMQCYSGRPENVAILLDNNADVHACDRKGRPPAFLVGGRGDPEKVYQLLKAKGLNMGLRDANENTLAHAMAQRAPTERFINMVFDDAPHLWTVKNMSGQTPMDVLNVRGYPDWATRLRAKVEQHVMATDVDAGLDMIWGRNAQADRRG